MRLAQHVGLPTIISKPGYFITRCGEVVEIESIDRWMAKGKYDNGVVETWDISGRLLPSVESQNDIMYAEGHAPVYWMQVSENRRLVEESVRAAEKHGAVNVIDDGGFVLITGAEADCASVVAHGILTVTDEGAGVFAR